MLVRYVLWELDGSKTTIEELRRYLADEAVDAFAQVPGLRFKPRIGELSRRGRAFEPGP